MIGNDECSIAWRVAQSLNHSMHDPTSGQQTYSNNVSALKIHFKINYQTSTVVSRFCTL